MDIQSVYYFMAVIFMSLLTIAAIGIIGLIIFIAYKVYEIQKYIEKKAEEVAAPFKKGSEFIDNLREKL